MSYWKSKVVPKFKKFFDKGKKKGAAEFSKSFDSSKESLDKEIADKSSDLSPKVVEIYRSSTSIVAKKLLKEPNEASVKGNPDAAKAVLLELEKAGFPGAKVVSEAAAKYGPPLLPGPVLFVLEKASTYLVEEPLPEEPAAETRELSAEDVKPPATEEPPPSTSEPEAASAPPPAEEAPPAAVEEEKKEEVPPAPEPVGDTPPAEKV